MNINILEIRNYLLQPGITEHFIDYFEAHFIASQQDVNISILGQFRVVGEPDHFVWLRGFSDMQRRLVSLRAFYEGPVWQKYGPLANAMMIDSDNVRLLRPLTAIADLTCGLTADQMAAELAAGTISPMTGMIAIDIYRVKPGKRAELIDEFQRLATSASLREAFQLRGYFVTEMAENTFPRLPVIQNEDEFVVITAYESERSALEIREQVMNQLIDAIDAHPAIGLESHLLRPTLRSALRWHQPHG